MSRFSWVGEGLSGKSELQGTNFDISMFESLCHTLEYDFEVRHDSLLALLLSDSLKEFELYNIWWRPGSARTMEALASYWLRPLSLMCKGNVNHC
ncbi:hypothetical protein Sjap_016290 [Stephania japonica]|uniref:Uncharacterized protein n=1 Tax=Stephania japonica TaxID=461633 RepID=A0AAP0IKT5_9MAGN